MAVNRNFVVKNGLTVNTSLLFVDSATSRIGIGSTVPSTVLDVIGGIAATDLKLTGISTISGAIYGDGGVAAVQIGTGISIAGITTLAGSGGITTTGGDLYVGGDLNVKTALKVGTAITAVAGIVTANYFYGDGSNLTNITAVSGGTIGIQSGTTYIGSGITALGISGSNSSLTISAPSSGFSTITLPTPGVSLGLAIALGG